MLTSAWCLLVSVASRAASPAANGLELLDPGPTLEAAAVAVERVVLSSTRWNILSTQAKKCHERELDRLRQRHVPAHVVRGECEAVLAAGLLHLPLYVDDAAEEVDVING
jgi:hypothetical protein